MMENMMIATQHNTRNLLGYGTVIVSGMLVGGLGAALWVLWAAATGL